MVFHPTTLAGEAERPKVAGAVIEASPTLFGGAYEDFTAQPHAVLRDMLQFLDVDATFAPDMSVRYNTAGLPRSRTLHPLLKQRNAVTHALTAVCTRERLQRAVVSLRNRNLRQAPPLSQEIRRTLLAFYRDDILTLQSLIQRDLSAWLR